MRYEKKPFNEMDMRRFASDSIVVVGITLLGAILRFWQLDIIPPGLHFDEAFHALEARDVLAAGRVPVFFEGNFGVLPMFAALISLSYSFFGQTPLALRAVSALVGTLTIPLFYLLVKEVLGSRPLGLLAATLLAISFQGIIFTREGLEPSLVPFFLVLTFWLLWRGWRTGGWRAFLLAGLAFGLGFYTYQAYWVSPLLMAGALAWLILSDRAALSRLWRQILVFGLAAILAVAPLGAYFLSQEKPTQRLAMIAATNPDTRGQGLAETLLRNLADTASMFTLHGDEDPRNNLPGRPMLDPIQSLGFLAGLAVCLGRWRRPGHALWLLWLVVMALPMTLSEYVPHFRRAIGVLPAVTSLSAVGLYGLWRAVKERLPDTMPGRTFPVLLLAAALLTSGFASVRDYFVRLGPTNNYYYAFDTGIAQMAWYTNTLPAADRVYYLPADNRHNTLRFLATRPVPRSFESRQAFVLAPIDGRDTVYVVVSMEDPAALTFLRRAYATGSVVSTGVDREGGIYFTAYRVPAGARPAVAPSQVLTATLGDTVALSGVDVGQVSGGQLAVTVYWRCLKPMDAAYTSFVHLVGPSGLAAQHDMQPGNGSYPTDRWEPGETIIDRFQLDVSTVAPGAYELRAGMYLLATLKRLPALDANGMSQPDDAIALAGVRL
jgi:4-amino-4-deoxy-L-arabinose transferase-like glycosyltransferase